MTKKSYIIIILYQNFQNNIYRVFFVWGVFENQTCSEVFLQIGIYVYLVLVH